MLEPRDRKLLFDLLRPPPGYRLDAAIGTTYSLDLLALLITPLAFARFDWEARDGKITASPLALLESLRRYADRLTVFHQSGLLQVPRRHRPLFGYLEQSVVPVSPRNPSGVFHPKVWLLRYEPIEISRGGSTPVVYRLICSSRNVTFDRAWDTALSLEGTYRARSKRLRENAPLRRFFAALPSLAICGIAPEIAERTRRLSEEVERVEFEPPVGFDAVRFWSSGADQKESPFLVDRVQKLLVISPFASDGLLGKLSALATKAVLVSRAEELDRLSEETLSSFETVYSLDPAAEIDPDPDANGQEPVDVGDATGPTSGSALDSPNAGGRLELSGLHAKVYVTETGKRASIWTGSANATEAAFGRNVEFLVGLEGPAGRCGLKTILDDQTGFAALLQKYVRQDHPATVDVEDQLQRRFDDIQKTIALLPLHIEVESFPEIHLFDLRLTSDPATPPPSFPDILVRCRPLSVSDSWFQHYDPGNQGVVFSRLPFESLTSFLVFELSPKLQTGMADRPVSRLFLLNLPLVGEPADRRERLLLSFLQNPRQVMRYLLLLLADEGWDARTALELIDGRSEAEDRTARRSGTNEEFPLLEAMVSALASQPVKLDQIDRLLEELKKTPEGTAIIPEGLLEVWQTIWRVRKERRDGQKP
jgi:hypothetical protein